MIDPGLTDDPPRYVGAAKKLHGPKEYTYVRERQKAPRVVQPETKYNYSGDKQWLQDLLNLWGSEAGEMKATKQPRPGPQHTGKEGPSLSEMKDIREILSAKKKEPEEEESEEATVAPESSWRLS